MKHAVDADEFVWHAAQWQGAGINRAREAWPGWRTLRCGVAIRNRWLWFAPAFRCGWIRLCLSRRAHRNGLASSSLPLSRDLSSSNSVPTLRGELLDLDIKQPTVDPFDELMMDKEWLQSRGWQRIKRIKVVK